MSSFLKRWRRAHDTAPKARGNAPTGCYVVSAFCGRYGGSARARRAVRNAHSNTPNGYRASEVLEATRRGVAYDKRRVRSRGRALLTATGLLAR